MTEKEPPSDPERLAHFQSIARSLMKESDRGCALIAAAMLDEYLEQLLRTYFRQDQRRVRSTESLFAGIGPLSSFWAKTQLAYALGLIGHATYATLERVRAIRNQFAHEYGPQDFDDETIKPGIEAMIGPDDPRPEDNTWMPGIVGKHGDFVRRLAFILKVAKVGRRITWVTKLLQDGHDVRRHVGHMEQQDEW